jgi:3'-5' exoribonuclease
VDRDLLVAGALVHDIGKTRELSTEVSFPYTREGKLLGHILLGLRIVEEEAQHVPELANERLQLLLHLVASHQGRYEWQSPREPRTIEALLLHYADDLDAKTVQALALLETVPDGWTGYDRSLARELLRHRSVTAAAEPGITEPRESREPASKASAPRTDSRTRSASSSPAGSTI